MQVPGIFHKSALSLSLIAVLLTPLPALASLSAADSQKLDQYEKTIFGKPRPQLSDESRLRALEINLFGKSKSGGQENRLAAITMAMSKPSTAKYLPPMSAAVDHSGAHAAKAAPLAHNDHSNYSAPATAPSYEPSPAPIAQADQNDSGAGSGSDHEKELLRQALERHEQGDRASAERLFKQVLSMNPRNVDANFNLGAMLEDNGDLNGALHYYQAAANLNPGDHDIQDALSSVRDKQHQQQVAQQTQAELHRKAQLKPIADEAATAYKAGKYDQAISALDRIASQTPNDANVQFGLAQAWRGKGDLNRAKQYLNRALSLAPDNQLYRSTLSDLDRDMQKHVARGGSGNGYGSTGNGPGAAPDYSASRGGPRANGYDGDGTQSFDNGDVANAGYNDPNGGVQPFNSKGEGRLYGHEIANSMRGGGIGMGGMGLGALGALSGIGMNRVMGGGPHYSSGRGTRLMRGAMTGALSGAAIGAMTNMHSRGGAKKGAMKGALYGGLFGLMTGF